MRRYLRSVAGITGDASASEAARARLHELLDAIEAVARSAAGGRPGVWVSTTRWNAERAACGRPDLPTAAALRRRLALPWRPLLRLAQSSRPERERVFADRAREQAPGSATPTEVRDEGEEGATSAAVGSSCGTPTPVAGRFTARLETSVLLDAVAEVARSASPDAPAGASKGRWDRERAALGRVELPRAESIRKRVGGTWPEALALALCPQAERARLAGQRKRGRRSIIDARTPFDPDALDWEAHEESSMGRVAGSDGANVLAGDAIGTAGTTPDDEDVDAADVEVCRRALRVVAHRLGESPGQAVYDATAQRLEDARGARAPIGLPASPAILARYGGWEAALADAGLADPPRVVRALPAEELLDRLIDETGILPVRDYFTYWCRSRGLPQRVDRRPWTEIVAATRALRAGAGKTTPAHRTPLGNSPGLAGQIVRVDGVRSYSRAEVLASLRRYRRDHLRPGARATQKDYLAACRRDRSLIWPRNFPAHGRFQDLIAEAGGDA